MGFLKSDRNNKVSFFKIMGGLANFFNQKNYFFQFFKILKNGKVM
jgi:hypothetical protein